MAGKFLLDTNFAIAILAGEGAALGFLNGSEPTFLSSIVLGELYYGARKSARTASNLAKVEELAAAFAVLNCDVSTARHYGKIRDLLRAKGRPIPNNDIWIAAHAQQYELTLVTRDEHFRAVEGIAVEGW
ncbi:MAG TPA: type II toxin-antitoxin system VapC family toxin [Terriglobia bacterium]|nr:type II toxin-antitoxin system VapC family toxin [Terriglobia bacterium]